jgi:hypothetical protein
VLGLTYDAVTANEDVATVLLKSTVEAYEDVIANDAEVICVLGLTYDAVIANDAVLICVLGLTYDAVRANDAESTEPVKAPMIGPVTVNEPVIVTFPT